MPGDSLVLHQFKNHLSVIIGFCDLMLSDLAGDDPKRADLTEIRKAAMAALALLPHLPATLE